MALKHSLALIGVAGVALAVVAACLPLKLINTVSRAQGVERTGNIAYGTDPRQRLDVYRPAGARELRPLVVFFYGGSWQGGKRQDYRFVGEALAERGFVAVVADYRVHPQVLYPEFLRDSAAVVAWCRGHAAEFGGDDRRLFLMGHSAGAYNVAMLALDRRWLDGVGLDARRDVRGWIGISGPYDFLPIKDPVVQEIFGPKQNWPDTQPINHASAGAPPALLLTGDTDDKVSPRNTRNLTQKLQGLGVAVDKVLFPGVGHARTLVSFAKPFRDAVPVLDEAARFIDAH